MIGLFPFNFTAKLAYKNDIINIICRILGDDG